jgi:hypothetical protein
MTNLMIAAAMMVAAAGSAPALTTPNDRPTLDNKSIVDVKATTTLEQRLDSSDIQKSDSISPKHPDAPGILVAPGGGCPHGCNSYSIIQQFQDYLPAFMSLSFLFL